MKNRFISVIALCIILACSMSVLVFALVLHEGERETSGLSASANGITRVLIAGLDESGGHTDVLMLLSASADDGSVSVMQIPRDTYVKYEGSEGKINRLYRECASKYGQKDGAEKFRQAIETVFGVPIDAYAVFRTEALETFVDSLGGIELSVPYKIDYRDKSGAARTLEAGKRRLNGEEALAYVRHRGSYAEGDLGRLDAQMRFIAAAAQRLPQLKFPKQYLEICQKNLPNLLTNLREKDIINLIAVYFKNRDTLSLKIMRLPGEACLDGGVWYYVLNRAAAESMLSSQMGRDAQAPFDGERLFTRDSEAFTNIYLAPNVSYRVYSAEEAREAKVLHK